MKKNEKISIIEEIEYLRKLIKYHNKLYYEEDCPEIDDYEYDLLLQQLKKKENKSEFLSKESPSQTIGSKKLKETMKTFTHPSPMNSLNNIMNKIELEDYLKKTLSYIDMEQLDFIGSFKFDGLAIELIYENGLLKVASTRGDGFLGEVVTKNIIHIKNIPKSIPSSISYLVVRGEVIMMKDGFERLNQERIEKQLPIFMNPRNAAAGTIRSLDHQLSKERKLYFFAYQLLETANLTKDVTNSLKTYEDHLLFLKKLNFDINEYTKKLENMTKIHEFYQKSNSIRESLPYALDGIVLKINDLVYQKRLGEVARRPRYAIAWKFPPDIKTTKLLHVHFQMGRTGILTPVGELEPVIISGATIRKVTLHNIDEIKRKDIQIQDTVQIIRSGDVIPKILGVIKEKRNGSEKKIIPPTLCPYCQNPLTTIKHQVATIISCTSTSCQEIIFFKLLHFISKKAMDIEGVNEQIIRELMQKKGVKNFVDIYRLSEEDFLSLDRMKEKRLHNLTHAIESKRNPLLYRLIYALGIKGVGLKTSQLLESYFKDISILAQQSLSDIIKIEGIGEVVAQEIVNYFQNNSYREQLQELLKEISPIYKEKINTGIWKDKLVLFTGTLSIPRRIAKENAEKLGAKVSDTMGKNISLLIIGKNPGSKLKKAKEFQIPIMEEEKFLQLIDGNI